MEDSGLRLRLRPRLRVFHGNCDCGLAGCKSSGWSIVPFRVGMDMDMDRWISLALALDFGSGFGFGFGPGSERPSASFQPHATQAWQPLLDRSRSSHSACQACNSSQRALRTTTYTHIHIYTHPSIHPSIHTHTTSIPTLTLTSPYLVLSARASAPCLFTSPLFAFLFPVH